LRKSDIYEIAIKIIGLYLFATTVISAIDNLFGMFAMVSYSKQDSDVGNEKFWIMYLMLGVVQLVVPTLISLFFFFKANFIVRKICSASDFEENAYFFAQPTAIYEMALIVTGLLLIIWMLPEFGYQCKNFYQTEHNKLFKGTVNLKSLWVSTAKIFVGTFLLLLAKQLSGYFGKSRKLTDELN
jgi:uncharacterized membrane protein